MQKMAVRGSLAAYFRETWWKYALLIASAIFAWNMIFASTAPVIPEEHRLDVFFCAGFVDVYALEEKAEEIAPLFPEMQRISLDAIPIDIQQESDYAYQMQFMLRMSERQGDVIIMSKERFDRDIVPEDFFLPLADVEGFETFPIYEADGAFAAVDLSGFDLSSLGFDATDCVAFLPYYCSNPKESAALLQWLASAG